jgi:hypothetical protein
MSSAVEQEEDGLELADLGHIRLAQSPRPDDASSDSFQSANLLARYSSSDSHSGSAHRVGNYFLRLDVFPRRIASRGDGDSKVQHDNNSRSCNSLRADQHHASDEPNNYHAFEDPSSSALESPDELASVALTATRSNQRNRHHG